MKIVNFLVKHGLIHKGDCFLNLSESDDDLKNFLKGEGINFSPSATKSADFVAMNVHGDLLSNDSTETFKTLKDGWNRTTKVFAVSTSEKKSKGLEVVLQNIIGAPAVPAAPGLYYFFKNKDLIEYFAFKIHDSNSQNIKEDLLVYLALAKLKNENVLASLPQYLKTKVLRHLGNNIRALAESRKLLTCLGDRKMRNELCSQSDLGIQDDEAMWIHTSLIKKLHPALRVYIGCSSLFFGDPESADIVKIHKKSSKITFYLYDDFENKLLPEMHDRIKIDLSKQKVDHFDHRSNKNPEVVYFKERFIPLEHGSYAMWKSFSEHLTDKGYSPENIHIEQCKKLSEILKNYSA